MWETRARCWILRSLRGREDEAWGFLGLMDRKQYYFTEIPGRMVARVGWRDIHYVLGEMDENSGKVVVSFELFSRNVWDAEGGVGRWC